VSQVGLWSAVLATLFGIASAYSNLGGNVVTVGAKPDGSPWHIGIQHPRQENGLIGAVSVVNQTVVTSGDYQRYFTDSQGKRHHHILDPTTGYPAESGLISVSIVTDKSVAADALSTILFVAGMEKGLEFLSSFPQTEAILVDSNLQVYVTQGLRCRFQVKEHREAKSLPLNAVDFSRLSDGAYHGAYAGGMYKWRANECQVTVSSGRVTGIQLVGTKDPAAKNTQHEVLYDRVIQAQSLQVDTISSATLTSKAYLKAVENALLQAQHE